MEQKKPVSHIVAGLLIGVAIVIVSVILSMNSSKGETPGGGLLSFLIVAGGLSLFIFLYGKAHNNQETFGNLFAYGFKATAVMTLVVVIYMIALSFITPELKEMAVTATREKLEKDNRMTDSDIDRAMSITSNYFWVIAIGGSVLVHIILGAIGSLIGAAITPKRPKNPFDQPNL